MALAGGAQVRPRQLQLTLLGGGFVAGGLELFEQLGDQLDQLVDQRRALFGGPCQHGGCVACHLSY